ncbi:MAG TPA: hypothetical protein PKA63_13630 [Oligoflexia bacterium]|nr:hypothetical protein [Oligoflexia bacterium]HMP49703.1 hypothetical protein [Oligoflexia bacterium]
MRRALLPGFSLLLLALFLLWERGLLPDLFSDDLFPVLEEGAGYIGKLGSIPEIGFLGGTLYVERLRGSESDGDGSDMLFIAMMSEDVYPHFYPLERRSGSDTSLLFSRQFLAPSNLFGLYNCSLIVRSADLRGINGVVSCKNNTKGVFSLNRASFSVQSALGSSSRGKKENSLSSSLDNGIIKSNDRDLLRFLLGRRNLDISSSNLNTEKEEYESFILSLNEKIDSYSSAEKVKEMHSIRSAEVIALEDRKSSLLSQIGKLEKERDQLLRTSPLGIEVGLARRLSSLEFSLMENYFNNGSYQLPFPNGDSLKEMKENIANHQDEQHLTDRLDEEDYGVVKNNSSDPKESAQGEVEWWKRME